MTLNSKSRVSLDPRVRAQPRFPTMLATPPSSSQAKRLRVLYARDSPWSPHLVSCQARDVTPGVLSAHHGVRTSFGKGCDTHPHQTASMPSSTISYVGSTKCL